MRQTRPFCVRRSKLGRPELTNAPVIVGGLSAQGCRAMTFTLEHADRVLAVMAKQPVIQFKSDQGFTPWPQADYAQDGLEVSRMLGVPMLLQTTGDDGLLGNAMAYKFHGYGRGKGAPWTYSCRPDDGHPEPLEANDEATWRG